MTHASGRNQGEGKLPPPEICASMAFDYITNAEEVFETDDDSYTGPGGAEGRREVYRFHLGMGIAYAILASLPGRPWSVRIEDQDWDDRP
jgi:fermentation-respiration switch protein FrsA (DUF1100 family)